MKPNESKQAKKHSVAPGLYLDPSRNRYTYRPRIDGRRTERTLKARTDREARREYARVSQAPTTVVTSVADLITAYLGAGVPGAGVTPRNGEFAEGEKSRCKSLTAFFGSMKAGDVRVSHCMAYKRWRVKRIKREVSGGRTVDMDLGTLSNVFRYGAISGLVESNPMAQRPRFRGEVEHCRDHCCRSGDELHATAKALGGILALQFLFEATSGCRTGEVLPLRRDAKPGLPGHIRAESGERYLCISRLKQGGEDPFDYIHVNPALALVLEALDRWHVEIGAGAGLEPTRVVRPHPRCLELDVRYAHSRISGEANWFFPGRNPKQHLGTGSLSQALGKIKLPDRKLTSHGCRAFYVTWRRVEKVDLHQIAAEVGHQSGVALLLNVYGRRIPAWAAAEFSPYPKTVKAFWDSTRFTTTDISTGQHCATHLNHSEPEESSAREALVHYLPNNRPVLETA